MPQEIGLFTDGFGFLGVLDLMVQRKKYGGFEYMGLSKDHASSAYVVDFHYNENLKAGSFFLRRSERTHDAHIYYFNVDGFARLKDVEAYHMCLGPDCFCRFSRPKPPCLLPWVQVLNRPAGEPYEVVKARR